MKILVTGGAGFIGSHLCRKLLHQGNEVICLDNLSTCDGSNILDMMGEKGFQFWRHDVCDKWHYECDRIYHLACPASPVQYQRNPVRTIKTAVLGTLNALELARDTGARLLISSTSEVYGDPLVHPQVETYYGNVNPIGPRSCYDEGKRVGESLATSWSIQYGTDVRIARIFNTYGPGMASSDGRLIPNLVDCVKKSVPLTVYGDGSQTRSWCYVSDTVSGLNKLMEASDLNTPDDEQVPVFNIGNPTEFTINILALNLIEWVENNYPDINFNFLSEKIQNLPLPQDDPKVRRPDITRAKSILGWEPTVGFYDGLDSTLNYFWSMK